MLLLPIGAALLVLVVVGIVMLVIAAVVRRSGRNQRPLAWTGFGVLMVPVLFLVGVVVFGQLTEDPDTIVLDLREPIRLSSLPEDDEEFPGMRDYDSEHVDLVLPHGERFKAEVDGVLVWTDDGYVTRVSFDRRAREQGEAETLGATWEAELGGSGAVEVQPDYSTYGRVRGEVLTSP